MIFGKGAEENRHLKFGTIPAFGWKDWGKRAVQSELCHGQVSNMAITNHKRRRL
jgi:hypothetical protein